MRPNSEGADNLLNWYYPVLDHGFVSLVDYMGNDISIEHAARISYGKGTRSRSETRGLLRYLKRHAHTTPFEMVELKFHMAMPIFVARQWVRHRTASINEYSGRYSLMPNVTYTPPAWRLQSKTNNQGSSASVLEGSDYQYAQDMIGKGREHVFDTYDWMNAHDVAKELSRIDLPLSTYTQWYWKIDLHNLMHLLGLRCDGHAQDEIRWTADVVAGIVREGWPLSYECWLDYHMNAVKFSRMEVDALQHILTNKLDAQLTNLTPFGISGREAVEFHDKLSGKHRRTIPPLPEAITIEEAYARLFPEDQFDGDK